MEVRPNKKGFTFPNVIANASEGEHTICQLALGNMTQLRVLVAKTRYGVFIAVESFGAYEFQNYVDAGYAGEKLGLKFKGDAQNMADFINDQLGADNTAMPLRQGKYEETLCYEVRTK